jgi:hypothetical protein
VIIGSARGGAGQGRQPMPVSFNDLREAFEFANMSGVGEHQAVLCKPTGKIHWRSDLFELDESGEAPADELPADFERDENYVVIPSRRALGLGKPLALDFSLQFLPDDFEEVRDIFSRRGAYKKFHALLIRRGVQECWYGFETKALDLALRQWCELNSIEVVG